jgi:hypothetical protein
MKHIPPVVFPLLLALAALAAVPSAQEKPKVSGEDPLLGTWRLIVSQSKYKPGPPPQSQVRIYEKHPFGIKATVRTIYADGRSTTVQSIYAYDKEEYPVTGSEDFDAIIVKRINAYVHEATLSHAGHEIGSFRRVISRDGKQMTVSLQRSNPPADNVEVYEKEEQP